MPNKIKHSPATRRLVHYLYWFGGRRGYTHRGGSKAFFSGKAIERITGVPASSARHIARGDF